MKQKNWHETVVESLLYSQLGLSSVVAESLPLGSTRCRRTLTIAPAALRFSLYSVRRAKQGPPSRWLVPIEAGTVMSPVRHDTLAATFAKVPSSAVWSRLMLVVLKLGW